MPGIPRQALEFREAALPEIPSFDVLRKKMKTPQDELNQEVTQMVKLVYSGKSNYAETYKEVKEMLQLQLCEEDCSTVTLTNYGAVLSDTGQHGAAVPHLKSD